MRKAKVIKIANLSLRLLIIGATFWYLYDQLIASEKIQTLSELLAERLNNQKYLGYLLLSIILMPVNLFLESVKWQFQIRKLEKVKLNKAFTAVLSGISVSMFLPNRMGDYLGRVFILEKGSHIKGVLLTIIGSLAQLLVTIIIGGLAVLFFLPLTDYFSVNNQWLYSGILILILVLLSAGIFIYFNIRLLYVIVKYLYPRKSQKILPYVEVFNYFTHKQLAYILGLSMLRYGVFSLQYILFLWAFELPLNYPEAFMLVGVSYLFITLIPTVALSELGVRGSVSIFIFSVWLQSQQLFFDSYEIGVFAASSVVWLVNIVVPALLGVFFVYRLKFFRRENGTS
ncbi:MAG TPA: lysylphosphatidylglycerol synthase domain-containing protein [Bacteroidales bacterium]|nr:lysylphosphatidylglycerol synthase domain-containing protein [Bacteroidales bacterium]